MKGGKVSTTSRVVIRLPTSCEPQAYIGDVIAKIAGGGPISSWDELMPWNCGPYFQTVAEAA
jgi:hypothetical protein